MNDILQEMRAVLNGDQDALMHYGIPRRSGRYPWGSGEDPYQHGSRDFLGRIEELKKQGWEETPENIKKEFGLTTTQYRIEKSIAKDERRALDVARAKSLKEDGLGATEIGRQMGINESTVRSLLNEKSESRMRQAQETANFLKSRLDESGYGMIEVGSGVERELNISKEKLNQAIYLLEREGYVTYTGGIPQPTNPGQQTIQKVLCVPGTEHKAIYEYDKIESVKKYISRDNGETFEKKFTYPESMDSSRLKIRYLEEGGIEKDGIVEIRRGVEDLSLGESHYAQVRILVDGTHYIKGMALYSDDMPDGVDVVFNTNKSKGTPMTKVLKEIKDDPDNPFGSLIKDADQGGQYWYTDKDGNKKLGLINKRADEGDWDDWADALPSQFLAKQNKNLAKQQLGIAKADKVAEYDELCSLTNPTVKKHLLDKFADGCDSAAEHLKAAALPGQKYHVIIPVNSLKDNEVYAPKYEDGTELALIRYPHGGTFEIPILRVNNKHAAANKLLGKDIVDAVGINSKVAERLSGADFDGDTVMCIPTNNGKVRITSTPPLKGLEGFDPKTEYGPDSYAGRTVQLMSKKGTQTQMGIISNLITDMTLAGADENELARAVRHSMVVIDAHKHKLDYKQSEKDNNIAALHKEYQGHFDKDGKWHNKGASTILSKAKGEVSVDKRQGNPKVNKKGEDWYDPNKPEGSLIYQTAEPKNLYKVDSKTSKTTGLVTVKTLDGKKITYDPKNKEDSEKYRPIKKVDSETGEITFTNKAGNIKYASVKRTQPSTNMAETDDAYSLVSDARHPMELLYADYANSMKALANQARMESLATGKIKYDAQAAKTYSKEVTDLKDKLNTALLNSTKEREALRRANAEVAAKTKDNPNLDKGDIKKLNQQAVSKYRQEVGALSRKERNIEITDREWEAIQAGAVSENTLKSILNNTDTDQLRQRATPRTMTTLNPAKISKINNMNASGNYSLSQIAIACGVSVSTVSNHLKGANNE
ncbi:MAG: hypothetical protein IKY27_00405 [Bacteroidales bacterium]|nr:hypothetical protein [Bacteroidales bacterium]